MKRPEECNGECPECWETDCPDSPSACGDTPLENCCNCGIILDDEEHDIQESVDFTGLVFRFCSVDCMGEWEEEQRAPGNPYDEDYLRDYLDFREPGGRSALRNGPRIHPCPNCGEPNVLTPRDVQLHYQCDRCADELERGY